MSLALYRKWRPRRWEDVVGQQHVIQTLNNAVTAQRVAHAYLFAGARGTGKTTTARLLAKAVNCLHEDLSQRPCDECEPCQAVNEGRFWDLIEIDAASNTSVEDIRALREKINFSPNQGRYKVYIIDEVHMLSTAAFNALLKTLEEPPAHALFILATTDVHKIPATVLSRCQRHEFRRIPVNEIVDYLQVKAQEEGMHIDNDALRIIARQSTGCLRDAISLLDQISSGVDNIDLNVVQMVLGTTTSQDVVDLVDSLQQRDYAKGLAVIQTALDRGVDARQFSRQWVDYLRSLLLVCMGDEPALDTSPDMLKQIEQHAQSFSISNLLKLIKIVNQADVERRNLWLPSLPLELAFVECMLSQNDDVALSTKTAPQYDTEVVAHIKEEKISVPVSASSSRELKQRGAIPQGVTAEDEQFQLVLQHWRAILGATRQISPQTQALLNSIKPLVVRDGVLLLDCVSDFLKSKIENDDHIAIARRAVKDVTQQDLEIKCFVNKGKGERLPSGVDNDSMVAVAVLDCGGKIVNEKNIA